MIATRWKPAVLKAFAESDCLVNDLESGKVTREDLIARGELKPFDEFLKNLQNRAFYCYAIKGDIIYILNGFVKKTQKTPLAEIRKAKAIKRGLGL